MVTVATTVDAPMKLIVETGTKTNILGLGDIAVPCMLIALALRFDLWMHYQAKVKQVPDTAGSKGESESESHESEEEKKEVIAASKGRYVQLRSPYVDVTGRWADWMHTLPSPPWKPSGALPKEVTAASFGKPYFYAAIGGYAVGLVAAMVLSVVFKHGQPALLYLVPGVIGPLCLTAILRGEMRYMVAYNEDGRLDLACGVVELDEGGKLVRFVLEDEKEKEKEDEKGGEKEDRKGENKTCQEAGEERSEGWDKKIDEGGEKQDGDSKGNKREVEENDAKGSAGQGKKFDVFLFRVSAPCVEGSLDDRS